MQDTQNTDTMRQLRESVERMIDHASFRQCYERNDSTIKFFVIVDPAHSLAAIASLVVEGATGGVTLDQLAANGTVTIIPDIFTHLARYAAGPDANELALRRHLEAHIDMEVRAFYCAPAYFVQFTGQRWE